MFGVTERAVEKMKIEKTFYILQCHFPTFHISEVRVYSTIDGKMWNMVEFLFSLLCCLSVKLLINQLCILQSVEFDN